MNKFLLCLTLLAALFVSGCGSNGNYQITNRSEGSGTKVLEVEVLPSATQSEIQNYSDEIVASEKVEGKDFIINFFDSSGRKTSNVVANYLSGTVTMLTPEDRAESAKEGD